jgi:hypothetical protein
MNKNKLFSCLVLSLLVLGLLPLILIQEVHAGVLFGYGFEAGLYANMSPNGQSWTPYNGAGARFWWENTTVHTGSHSFKMNWTSSGYAGVNDGCQFTLWNAYSTIYTRAYFDFGGSLPNTNGQYIDILSSGGSSDGAVAAVRIWQQAGIPTLSVYCHNGTSVWHYLNYSWSYQTNIWYSIELYAHCASSYSACNGQVEVWLNGNPVITSSANLNLTYSGLYINWVYLGGGGGGGATGWSVYIDDMQTGTTYNGPMSSTLLSSGETSVVAGASSVYYTHWSNISALQYKKFRTNSTGSWGSVTTASVMSSNGWANTTNTNPSGVGVKVGWWCAVNDTSGTWANTTILIFTTTASITVGSPSQSNTTISASCILSATFTSSGYYLSKYDFGNNLTGNWVWDTSWTAFPSSTYSCKVNKTITNPSSVGVYVKWDVRGNNTVPATAILSNQTYQTTSTSYSGWLHTSGNKILNSQGQTIILTGSCTMGLQGNYGVLWDAAYSAQTMQLYDTLAYYGANSIRVAINYEMFWESLQSGDTGGYYTYSGYLATMNSIVNYCQQKNLYIIWDFHDDYINGTFYGNGGSNFPIASSSWQSRTITIATALAKRYENYTSVIGIEPLNEPNTNPVYEQPTNPSEIAAFNTLATWLYNIAHAIHTADSRTTHYLVFVDGEEDSTTFADWTANGNKFFNNAAYWGTAEPNIVYVYHWYGWEFGFWTSWVAEYAAGNYAQAKTDMTTFYQKRFWYITNATYNEPSWYGEFGFKVVNTYNGTTIQEPQLDQMIKDICSIHDAAGISWNIFVMHTSPPESIINSFTATPTTMFNFKGQDAAPYFLGQPTTNYNPPSWSYYGNGYSTTLKATACNFTIYVYQTGTPTLAVAKFSWNYSGNWANITVSTSIGGFTAYVSTVQTLPLSGHVSFKWYISNSANNWTVSTAVIFAVTSVTNKWFFNWHQKDLYGNIVDNVAGLSWMLFNITAPSTPLSYLEGTASLMDGTYILISYFGGYFIGATSLSTATYGNKTGTSVPIVNLGMVSGPSGYMAFNDTVQSFSWISQTTSNQTFSVVGSLTGVPGYKIMGYSTQSPTLVKKNGATYTNWKWSSNAWAINTTALSTWEIDFPAPGITPPTMFSLKVTVVDANGVLVSSIDIVVRTLLGQAVASKVTGADGVGTFSLSSGSYMVSASGLAGSAERYVDLTSNTDVTLTLQKSIFPPFQFPISQNILNGTKQFVESVKSVQSALSPLFADILVGCLVALGLFLMWFGNEEDHKGAVVVGILFFVVAVSLFLVWTFL